MGLQNRLDIALMVDDLDVTVTSIDCNRLNDIDIDTFEKKTLDF